MKRGTQAFHTAMLRAIQYTANTQVNLLFRTINLRLLHSKKQQSLCNKSLSVFDEANSKMSNLYFIPAPANSDIFIEMRDNYVRVSSLLHSVTSCSSDTVSVENQVIIITLIKALSTMTILYL